MRTRLLQKTQLKINPELLMTSQLLRLSAADLEQLIWRELADNPALELASEGGVQKSHKLSPTLSGAYTGSSAFSDWQATGGARPSGEFDQIVERVVACSSPIDRLAAQTALMVDGCELEIAIHLLQSLDGHGYLRLTPEEAALELGVPVFSVERAIKVLHQLDPPGIGARDVRECFLLQCEHLQADGVDCTVAYRILVEAWDDFVNRRWAKVAQRLRLSTQVVEAAWRFIVQNFYPYPLLMLEDTSTIPETLYQADLIIHRENAGDRFTYRLEIPAAAALELRVSGCFTDVLRVEANANGELAAAERVWVRTQVDRAHLFIAALNQRWATLRRIGEYLIEQQVEFLQQGPRYLKSLTRAAVACDLGLHESTISRAVNEKIIQLPNSRLMPLSNFFDHSLAAKDAIRRLLTQAGKPLSDDEITHRLQADGLKLARRTVAKYRQQLKLPSSYRR